MNAQKPDDKLISPWEWLPPIAVLLLAAGCFFTEDGGNARRFCLYVGLGLVPGCLWRFAGKSSWSVHRLGFAAALAAFVLNNPSLWPGREVAEKLLQSWPLVACGLAIAATQPVWGALRFGRLLNDSGMNMRFFETFKLCLSGHFFNIFLPGATGGDLYRLYAVAGGEKRKFAPALASLALDRFLGMPPLVFMILLAVAGDWKFVAGHETLSGLMAFVGAAAFVSLLFMLVIWLGRNKDWGKDKTGVRGKIQRIHRLLAAGVSRPGTLPAALIYGFWSHAAVAAACAVFGAAVGVEDIPAWRYFLLVPLAMAINSIPGSPGGIGQGEIAMGALFELAAPGLGNSQAGVAVMLLLRIANMLVGLVGGVFYATGKIDLRQVEYDDNPGLESGATDAP